MKVLRLVSTVRSCLRACIEAEKAPQIRNLLWAVMELLDDSSTLTLIQAIGVVSERVLSPFVMAALPGNYLVQSDGSAQQLPTKPRRFHSTACVNEGRFLQHVLIPLPASGSSTPGVPLKARGSVVPIVSSQLKHAQANVAVSYVRVSAR